MKFIRFLIKLAVPCTALAIVAGFFGWFHPAFDTIANFRLHFSVALFAAAILMLLSRHFILLMIALAAGSFGLYTSVSGTKFATQMIIADASKPVYSMLHLNLLWNNPKKSGVIDLITNLDPELLSLTEASVLWDEQLQRLSGTWPYLFHCPEVGKRGGVKLYSKWPIQDGVGYCGDYGSLAKTRVTAPDAKPLDLGAVHIRWPWPASGPRQVDAARTELEQLGPDALIAGDFNSTTWSWTVERFSQYGRLQVVPGIGPTWIINWPLIKNLHWAGFPIDNVMHKGRVNVMSAKALSPAGSDHLPVLIEFQLQ